MRFLVLKDNDKLKKGTLHDKKEIASSNYYRFLLKQKIITEDEKEIEKYLSELNAISNKYSSIENKKFSYEIAVNSSKDNIELNTSDIVAALLRKLNLDFSLNTVDKKIILTINDIKKSDYKEIKLIDNDDYKLSIFIRFKEKTLKGKAKRLGLKSIFVKDNELLLTSFNKGDDVIIEKIIVDNDITKVKNIANPENYSIKEVSNKKLILANAKLKAEIDNPSYSRNNSGAVARQDYLQRKAKIENDFFGKIFNDNIHIQLAYNIMDIKKIFGLYVNEGVFTMENLSRDFERVEDFVGTLRYENSYYDLKDEKKKKVFEEYFDQVDDYLKYFSNAFSKDSFDKDKKGENKKRENRKIETYNILRTLSMFRQFSVHSYTDLYNLNQNNNKDLIKIINDRYDTVYSNLLDNTVKTSKNNIELIFDILKLNKNDDNLKKEILNDYFNFVINKSLSHMGFKFKTLKELLLKKLGINVLDDNKKDTYMVINFIIYKIISDKEDIVNKYVSELLASEKTTDKDSIYDRFADEIKPLFKNIITEDWVNYSKGKDKSDFYIDESLLNKPSSSNNIFYKAVYFLTVFLDKKEINMLLTSLINKVNNIKGFIKVLNNNSELLPEYNMFGNVEELDEISSSLNVVMTIARMQKNFNKKFKNDKNDSANKISLEMLYDAYCLFGYEGNKETFSKDTEQDRNQIKGKRIAKFQNKIGSAIANSNQFRYIIKYASPKECYKVMKNTSVIQFVLNEIPQTQIDKYLDGKYDGASKEDKIKFLSEELSSLNIYYMRQSYDINNDTEANQMKLPKLYMTVIYQIIKQMVRINAYYNIAFSCLERDRALYNIPYDYLEFSDLILVEAFSKGDKEFDLSNKTSKDNKDKINHISIDAPTNKYKRKVDGVIIDAEGPKLGSCKYSWIKDNIETFKSIFYKQDIKDVCTEIEKCNIVYRKTVRNNIAHLNVISNLGDMINEFCTSKKKMRSYFELYQYAIQKNFLLLFENNKYKMTEFLEECKNEIYSTKTYSKKLLHILNMPFAYNMARYKNLTIEDIFYDRFDNKIKKETE